MDDDEKLNGLFDGELNPKEQVHMEARVARDAELQAKLAEMGEADALVRAAFDGPMAEEAPDRFLRAIDAGIAYKVRGTTQTDLPQSNVIDIKPLPKTAQNDNHKGWWKASGAVAASLAIGLLLGTQWPNQDEGTISLALNHALESAPSAQTVALTDGHMVTPQLSFAKAGGSYCRQFELSGKSGPKSGVACRQDGRWVLEALLPSRSAASAEGGYVVAEGAGAMGVDTVIDKLRAGDPLDGAAEAVLIAKGWK